MLFQLFGSPTSQDYDVIVFVENIPSIKESATLCKALTETIEEKIYEAGLSPKVINTNIAVLEGGIITQVHKGTPDEVNNALFYTYEHHPQFYPNQIERKVERDIDLKLIRSVRMILSFLSKTVYRETIKKALVGDFYNKLKALEMIDFTLIADLGAKGPDKKDAFKSISFQFGQSIGLIEGHELYTKEGICNIYEELSPFLMREDNLEMKVLNSFKDIFISLAKEREVKYLYEPSR